MKRIMITLSAVLALAVMIGSAWSQTITELRNLGYVVVSPNAPDDGGDYGPNTPGTQTSGIQEAFNDAKDNIREVFIVGGSGRPSGTTIMYDLHTTLTIPWGQDWHCDGGDYVLNFTQTTGDCMFIDSQMNCMFRFGHIQAPNLQSGNVVRFYPITCGPDCGGINTPIGTSCIMHFSSITGGGGMVGNDVVGKGDGLQLDGPVVHGKMIIGKISGCQTAIKINGGTNNTIECLSTEACNTHLQMNGGSHFRIKTAMLSNDDLTVIGADLQAGDHCVYDLTWLDSFGSGNALNITSGSSNSLINAVNLSPDGISNGSTSNTVIKSVLPVGFSITTPGVASSGSYRYNTTGYIVVATILTPGGATSWTVVDSTGTGSTISATPLPGQTILLEPGDRVKFNYTTTPPTWAWRALR